MTWEEIMRRVLPPVGGVSPHITKPGAFGAGVEQGRHPPSTIPHKGVDFNYPVGQTGINKSYPMLHSPVAGVVTNAGEGNVGRIAIRDANGFTHEILHTHTQNVKKGDLVEVGAPIGTMGNTGVSRDPKTEGDYHVHYQLKDRSGKIVDPTAYWNHPFLDESQHAAEVVSGLDEKSPQSGDLPFVPKGRFDTPFSEATGNPLGIAPPPASSTPFIDRYVKFGSVPRPNAPAASGDAANFADRFGNWASAPAGALGDVKAPPQRSAPNPGQRSDIPGDVTPTSAQEAADVPVRRLVNLSSPAVSAPPLAPDVAASSSRPLGIFSGKPMRDYPVPPSIFQSRDQSLPEDNELFQRWMRWLDA